jgi:formylglycine-generating enzyme required for sulfatase activity
VAVLSAHGSSTVRYPVALGRSEQLALTVDLPPAGSVPDGFAYVPPGRFWFGAAEQMRSWLVTVPIHPRSTGAYLIAKHETTFADWIAFLDSLPPIERAARLPLAKGFERGSIALDGVGGRWRLSFDIGPNHLRAMAGERMGYPSRARSSSQDWLRFPVSGISAEDAEAYTRWLARTGRVRGARLCSEDEWERAARGADDREYPHGDQIDRDDANYDETYGRDPTRFGPDEVGAHPASRSPFGLDDMAGNVFEWTRSVLKPHEYVSRGGAYYFSRDTLHVTNRDAGMNPSLRDPALGLRVCATLPQPSR